MRNNGKFHDHLTQRFLMRNKDSLKVGDTVRVYPVSEDRDNFQFDGFVYKKHADLNCVEIILFKSVVLKTDASGGGYVDKEEVFLLKFEHSLEDYLRDMLENNLDQMIEDYEESKIL